MAAPVAPVFETDRVNLSHKSTIMTESASRKGEIMGTRPEAIITETEKLSSLSEDEKKALLLRSKEEFSNRRRVVIENLPANVTKENLEELLSGYVVEQTQIEGSKRKAQITLESGEEVSKVIEKLNNTSYRDNKLLVRMPPLEVICIMNLPLNLTQDEFEETVKMFGQVHRCFLIYSEKTGHSKGYGFVEYETTESALKARCELSGRQIGTKSARTDWAVPSLTTFSSLHSKCLLVEYLPKDTTDKEFRDSVSVCALPRFCKVAIGINKDEKTFGVVEFDKADDTEDTFTSLYGKELCEGKVVISLCTPGQTGHQIFSAMMARINGSHRKYLLPDPTPSALAQGNSTGTNNANKSLLGAPPSLPFLPMGHQGNPAAASMVTALVASHMNQFQQQSEKPPAKSSRMAPPAAVGTNPNPTNPVAMLMALQQQQQQQQLQQQVQQVQSSAVQPQPKLPLLGAVPTSSAANPINFAEKLLLGNGLGATQMNNPALNNNNVASVQGASGPNLPYLQAIAQAQQNLIAQLQQKQSLNAVKPSLLGDPTAALVQTQAAYIAALTNSMQSQTSSAATSPTGSDSSISAAKPKSGLLGHMPVSLASNIHTVTGQTTTQPPQLPAQQPKQPSPPPQPIGTPVSSKHQPTTPTEQTAVYDQYQQPYREQLNQYLVQQSQNGYGNVPVTSQAVEVTQPPTSQYAASQAAQQAYDYINKFMQQKQTQAQASIPSIPTSMYTTDPFQGSTAAMATGYTPGSYFQDPWLAAGYSADSVLGGYSVPYTPAVATTPVAGQKRSAIHLLPSPEPSPENGYVGQHSQGIGGHYADSYKRRKLV